MFTVSVMNSPEIFRQTVVVTLDSGLHMYPCSRIAQLVRERPCQVRLTLGKRVADAKNVVHMLGLAAEKGTELTIETDGEGAEQTLRDVLHLFEINFDPNRE